MSDVTKTAPVSPVSGTPTTPLAPAGVHAGTASAAEIPAAIANLSVGAFVTGTVVERNARGLVVLRTDKGTIKFHTPIAVKQGSVIALQIQSVGAQVQLSILSIDGQPLAATAPKVPVAQARGEAAVKPPAAEPPSARAPASPATTHATPSLTARDTGGDSPTVRANPLGRPAAGTAANAAPHPAPHTATPGAFVARPLLAPMAPANLPTLPPPMPATASLAAGDLFVASVMKAPIPASAAGAPGAAAVRTSAAPPPPMTPAAASATADGTPVIRGGASVAGAATVTPSTASAVANGTGPGPLVPAAATAPAADQMMLRLLSIETTGGETAATPHLAAALAAPRNAMTTLGVIVADGDMPAAPGHTLIRTALGLLSVAAPPPGPVGTRVLLEVMMHRDAGLPLAAHRDISHWLGPSPLGTGQDWPALRDIIAAMQTAAPQTAGHLLNVTLPRVGPNLAAGVLFFIAALRQGDPRAWLGEAATDLLQSSGHGALLDRLADDFRMLARSAAEAHPGNWQTLILPLHDGERLQQIRMYLRRQPRKDKNGRQESSTRFMIEAELSKFGPLQLDGLISKPQFDLVVRTRTPLPQAVRGDIVEIFSDALLATKLTGAVSFQATADLRAGPPWRDGEAGVGLIV